MASYTKPLSPSETMQLFLTSGGGESSFVVKSGDRGVLAGHAEPTIINYSSSIDGSSGDDMRYTGQEPNMVSVANGQVDETWVKTISFETDMASVVLGSSWRWSNGEAPVIKSKSVLVLYWNGTFGIANLMEGA